MSAVASDGNPFQPSDELAEGGEEVLPSHAGGAVEQPEPIALADETAMPAGAGPVLPAPGNMSSVEVAGNHEARTQELKTVHSNCDSGPQEVAAQAQAGHEAELSDAAEAAVAAGPKRRTRGTSRLGLLAMFAGIAACVLCRPSMLPPSLQFNPTTPALAGVALAFLALLGIVVGSRARSGLPLLAILLCLTAIGICAYQGGAHDINTTRRWADGQVERYRIVLSQLQKRVAPANPPAPATGANPMASQSIPGSVGPPQAGPAITGQSGTAARPAPPGTPVDPDAGIGAGTIFDMRPGSPGSPPGGTSGPPPPAPTPAPAGEPGVSSAPLVPGAGAATPITGAGPAHGAPATPRILSAQATLRAAQGKTKAAEDYFRYSFAKTNDPKYLAAQAEVNAADKLVEDAKRRSDGYGQPLIDATRQRKEAQEKVVRIENEAMARDPAVASSRGDLAAAEESLRQAYEAAGK